MSAYDYARGWSTVFPMQVPTDEAGKIRQLHFIARGAGPSSKAVVTSDTKVYSNYNVGNLSKYTDVFDYKNGAAIKWQDETMHMFVGAANRNANTIQEVISSGKPVFSNHAGGYLILELYMKCGFVHQRRCYLTPDEYDMLGIAIKDPAEAVFD